MREKGKKRKNCHWGELPLALGSVLWVISVAVAVTLNCRSLYRYDMKRLEIPRNSGYSEEAVLENYDALIAYNRIWFRGPLRFPSMEMSETGEIHFAEVKEIFAVFQGLALGLALPLLLGYGWAVKKRRPEPFRLTAILSVGLPALLGGLIALNWDAAFVLFHKIFFRNDFWIFDGATDPVIRILPDEYFLHCAVMILLLVVGMALLFLLGYRILRKKQKQGDVSGS